jgi:hypothetical protein
VLWYGVGGVLRNQLTPFAWQYGPIAHKAHQAQPWQRLPESISVLHCLQVSPDGVAIKGGVIQSSLNSPVTETQTRSEVTQRHIQTVNQGARLMFAPVRACHMEAASDSYVIHL